MTGNVVVFPSHAARRVPSCYAVVSRAGTVRGVHVGLWRTVEGNGLDIMLSPVAGGYTMAAHFTVNMLDTATLIAEAVLVTLQTADETWPVQES